MMCLSLLMMGTSSRCEMLVNLLYLNLNEGDRMKLVASKDRPM